MENTKKTSQELENERWLRNQRKWASRKTRWDTWKTAQNINNNGRTSFTVVITPDGKSHDID